MSETVHRSIVDVRPEADFLAGHAAGAASLPLEELETRLYELPPRDEPLAVFDRDPARAEAAAALLREREYDVVPLAPEAAPPAEERGPARVRLWRPNGFIVESIERLAWEGRGRRALDLACGSGRDAVWLALRGFEVEALDLLPDALERARDLARRAGVRIEAMERDIEREPALPEGRYDLVCVFHFLWRPLFPAIRAALRPGGAVVYETFHERTRETGRPPRNPAHLLRSGELAAAFEGFEVLIARDAAPLSGRYVSSLLARRVG